jgi:phosphatidylglycerophosphatase C
MSDMGSERPSHQTPSSAVGPRPGQAVAAFDFDGTLTIRDSFTAFLRWRAGPGGWMLGLVRMAPAVAAYARDRDRGRIKAASVKEFLGGVTRQTLESDAERFAESQWSGLMRPDALACWNAWGERGAWRVIVTASPETTVAPFASRLGADDLLGTQLVFDGQDRVTGAFATENCRAAEKVRRLRAAYGDQITLAAAYGDTSGDTEMLQIAEERGFRVFKGRP